MRWICFFYIMFMRWMWINYAADLASIGRVSDNLKDVIIQHPYFVNGYFCKREAVVVSPDLFIFPFLIVIRKHHGFVIASITLGKYT